MVSVRARKSNGGQGSGGYVGPFGCCGGGLGGHPASHQQVPEKNCIVADGLLQCHHAQALRLPMVAQHNTACGQIAMTVVIDGGVGSADKPEKQVARLGEQPGIETTDRTK
jgi:hypothetical protein